MKPTLDVVIVEAGAAGIGLLQALGVKRFALLERREVGASRRRWRPDRKSVPVAITLAVRPATRSLRVASLPASFLQYRSPA